MLEPLDHSWNRVDPNQRIATFTTLRAGKYMLRVQGSNNRGVWNEQGVTLRLEILPPWWGTTWFRMACAGIFLALLWAGYQLRVRQLHHQFDLMLEARVGERTRIARELHDTLLQSFHGLLLRFQTALYLLPDRPAEAKEQLAGAIDHAAKAITEGRDAVQGLRASTIERNDLALAIRTLGDELATDASATRPPAFNVAVEGRRASCIRFFVTRSTRLRRKPFGMPSGTRMPGGSRSRSATTTRNSACACVTMARGSIRRCSQTRVWRDTTDCAACQNAPH